MPAISPRSTTLLRQPSTAGASIDLEAFARAGGIVHLESRQPEGRASSTSLDLAQWSANQSVGGWGLTDAQSTSPYRARQANVGLFSELLRIRAQNIARAVVGVRGEGFAVQRLGSQNEWENVESAHPWVRLLARPNPERHPLQIWTWASLCRDLTGRAAFVVEDDARGMPIGLWEIYPEFGDLAPVPNARGGIEGWVFLRADGQRVELEARDVLVWEHPDPTSPFRTSSLLERAAFNLDKGLYADVYERDQLRDARRPPVYLSSDQELNPTKANEYGTNFKQTYFTPGREVKKIPVLGKGLAMHPFALNAVDLALIESLEANDERLFWMAGVPQGLYDKTANRANVFGARRVFADLTLQPESDGLAGSLTIGLERSFRLRSVGTDGTIEVRSPDLSPTDPMEEARVDEIELRSGTTTANEVRARKGRPDVEGGDVPMISGALRPLDRVANPPPPPPALASSNGGREPETEVQPGNEEPDASAEDEPDAGRVSADVPSATLLRIAGIARRAGADLDDDALQAEWQAVDEARQLAATSLQAAAADVIRRMADAAAEGVEANLPDVRVAWTQRSTSTRAGDGTAMADLVFRLDEWLIEWDAALGPFVLEILAEGYRTGTLRLAADLAWDPTRPGITEALAASLEQAASVPRTIRDEVGLALANGLAAGESPGELAERVRGHVAGMADWKGEQVARTTGGGAFEAGELASFREGGVTHKRWLSERDGKVRASHAGLDGEEVELETAFSNGMMHPLDPSGPASEVINCRCTLLPSTPESRGATWTQRRNAWMRSEYLRRRQLDEGRTEIIEALQRGRFEGRAFALAFDTVRKACDGQN